MSSISSNACICLDSSLLLADTLQNQEARTRLGVIDSHQRKLKLESYLPITVKTECQKRIANIISFISDTFRNFEREFRTFKSSSNTVLNDVDLNDSQFVREFFIKNYSLHKKPTSEYELLLRMEEMIVTHLTRMVENINSIPYREFVTTIGVGINKISTTLSYDFHMRVSVHRVITAKIDTALLQRLKSDPALQKTAQKKPNDLQIICEVEANQREIKKWSILVTLDKNDFLNNAAQIEKIAKVNCVDPLYLLQVLKRLESVSVT